MLYIVIVFFKVKEIFPEMTSDKVVDYLVRIKVESQSGNIAGYSVDQILGKIQDYQELDFRKSGRGNDPASPARLPGPSPSQLARRVAAPTEDKEKTCSICLEDMDPKGTCSSTLGLRDLPCIADQQRKS